MPADEQLPGRPDRPWAHLHDDGLNDPVPLPVDPGAAPAGAVSGSPTAATMRTVSVVTPSGIVLPGSYTAREAAELAVGMIFGNEVADGGAFYHDDDAKCRMCGCTNAQACAGGCEWVEDPEGKGPLCSACYVKTWRMGDDEGLQLITELVELSRDPATPPATLQLRPYEAFSIVSALQAVITHSGVAGGAMEEILSGWGRQVQALFGGRTWFLLEQGWHRELDRQAQEHGDGR